MRLSDEQARQLQSYLMRNRPNISRSEQRQSRRIEGAIVDDDVDARGFRSVVVYIQRGLGDQAEGIRQVLRQVTAVQDQYRLEYPVHLFSFDWDDGKLHHKGRNRMGGHNINCGPWTQELCDLAGTDEPSSPASIPSLFPLADPYGPKHHVERDDLLIFFCRGQNVCMSEVAKERYDRHPAKHSIWIFSEDDRVDMALGSFEANVNSRGNTLEATVTTNPLSMQSAQPVNSLSTGNSSGICRYLNDCNILRAEHDMKLLVDLLESDFPEVELCIRDNYLNLYHRGNSLAKIEFKESPMYRVTISDKFYTKSRLNATKKYHREPTNKSTVQLDIRNTDLASFFSKSHISDLCMQIKKVNYCEEISTEQILIVDNKGREDFIIIDRQIAFPGQRDVKMDLLALRQVKPKTNQYSFEILEVKLGNNHDLEGPVAEQLDKYITLVNREFSSYKACYQKQYEQKKRLRLIEKPEFENIQIVEGVTGVVVVTGYLGTAKSRLEKLTANHPDLRVVRLALKIPCGQQRNSREIICEHHHP